jgi:hypothetical protein
MTFKFLTIIILKLSQEKHKSNPKQGQGLAKTKPSGPAKRRCNIISALHLFENYIFILLSVIRISFLGAPNPVHTKIRLRNCSLKMENDLPTCINISVD